MIRFFDIIITISFLLFTFPLFFLIACFIKMESKGGIFYKQKRAGRNSCYFEILKFRSMYVNSDKKGLLTVGNNDHRITKVGYFLRKYKLDELPQFLNVLMGDMSIVGPRPEVQKYIDCYPTDFVEVLAVKPGITDYASIKYRNENEILSVQPNPEQYYIDIILPDKIRLNKMIKNLSISEYFRIIYLTLKKI